MQLLQVTVLFFFLSARVCRSQDSEDVQNNFLSPLPEASSTKSSVITPSIVSGTNLVNKSTAETTPQGLTSLTTTKHEESTTPGIIKNQVPTMNTTVTNLTTSNAVSTQPSSQNTTENQSSIKTTEISVTTQRPDALTITNVFLTTAKTISQLQGTEDGKITSPPSTTPSYSSIILPVVIALIVITLLVFTLVGLYRMCWKRDPGTPENGNDHRPQSDKESVKLLTVKTISHESGENSAQGKTKN